MPTKSKSKSTATATATATVTPESKRPLRRGNVVLIRTAVYHALGRVEDIYSIEGVAFVLLSEAAYVGDTGHFSAATELPLDTVQGAEIEPVADGFMEIQIASIGDVVNAKAVVRRRV
jgi:hypothetical protein